MNVDRIIQGLAAASLLVLGASACSPSYEGVDIQRVAGHRDAHGSDEGFSVPEGGLYVFSLDPQSVAGRRDYEVTDTLELVAREASVARIEQGLASGTWMLLGVAQGQTDVELWINGELQDVIPVEVLAQEDSP